MPRAALAEGPLDCRKENLMVKRAAGRAQRPAPTEETSRAGTGARPYSLARYPYA